MQMDMRFKKQSLVFLFCFVFFFSGDFLLKTKIIYFHIVNFSPPTRASWGFFSQILNSHSSSICSKKLIASRLKTFFFFYYTLQMLPSCPHLLWYNYLLLLCSAAGYLYSVFKERERSLIKWLGGSSVNATGEPLEWYVFKSGPVFCSLTSILTLWQRRISIVLCALVHDFRTRNIYSNYRFWP